MTYDAIVIGLGGMGSATLFELARRGLKVLGIEQFSIPHELGSSHGLTRIIRLPYFEGLEYVPLLFRAYELWEEIDTQCSEKLLYITGSIDAGPEVSRTFQGSLAACREFSLPHEIFDSHALNKRFPGYEVEPGFMAVLQPRGGFLVPERCVGNYVRAAQEHGAEVHTGESVTSWESSGGGVKVRTAAAEYSASRLVITAGPWARNLVGELAELAIPERQVVLWTEPLEPALFQADRFPVFNLQASDDGLIHYYGFPIFGVPGFKIGRYHHLRQRGNPEDLRAAPDDDDERILREGIARFFPKANGPALAAKTCLFTNSPDFDFILDLHPSFTNVAVAAGFSGHGFKFCSVVGEIMAELITRGETRHNIARFCFDRFRPSS